MTRYRVATRRAVVAILLLPAIKASASARHLPYFARRSSTSLAFTAESFFTVTVVILWLTTTTCSMSFAFTPSGTATSIGLVAPGGVTLIVFGSENMPGLSIGTTVA